MKTLFTLILCFLFTSCEVTKPVRKPIGTGIAVAGGALVDIATKPADKVADSTMSPIAKAPLYIITYPIAVVGGTVGFGMFVGGVMIYPEFMN